MGLLVAAAGGGGGGGGGGNAPANRAPTASPDTASATEGGAVVTGSVATNDSDPDGDPLTFSLTAPVAGLTLNANGAFSFDPTNPAYNSLKAGETQAVVANYTVSDGRGGSATSTLTITVTGTNDAPVAVANSFSTNEDTVLNVPAPGVLGNDVDPDGNPITAVLVSNVAHGTLVLNANGSFSYTPTANYNGPDSFTYRANDGTVAGNTVTVNLTVNPVNDAPVAAAESFTTAEDTPLVIAAPGVLANDTDVDGNALTAVLVTGPAHGTLTLNANGSFNYTPVANYNGPDSFTYKPNDGTADGNTVTVSLTVTPVNDAPVAVTESYSTNEDTPLVVPAVTGVLANDTDVEGNPLTAVLVSGPAHGVLTLNPDGSFVYTPDANYNGPDSFTYKPNDGSADGNTVTVNLTVNPVNDAPDAVDDLAVTAEDTPVIITVVANDTDIDGDTLTPIAVGSPAHGTAAINGDGTITYTPDANFNGPDSFTYTVSDGHGGTDTATVTVTVTPVNDAPAAVADSYSTNEDTPLIIVAPGVLSNDTDVEGDPLTAVLVSGVAHGTLTLNADGSFTYTPDANFNGSDSFTYQPSDGSALGNTVTVSLTVNPVNDAPVAAAESFTTAEDTPLVIAAPGVLANDTDVDGNALTAVLVTGPAHGTLTLNANGSFNYTPAANYNGPDSFTYKPNDGTADGNTVTVSLTVTPVNDVPAAVADSYSTDEDTPLTVAAPGVLANDSDVEGSPLTAALVSNVSHGSLTLNPNGSFTYTPDANYNGADSFTYKANDGTADGNIVTVSLTVNPVNDTPVAIADSYITAEDTPLVIAAPGVLGNDTDVDGDILSSLLMSDVSHGTLLLNPNGSFTYTPDTNYNGPDSFTYKVNDGTVDGNTVTVDITVTAVNDVPASVVDNYSLDEDTSLSVAAPGVLGNDSDVEGSPLTAALVSDVSHGTLTFNSDGSFDYTPDADYFGPDSFTYKANDGTDDGPTTTVNLTVNPINDTPIATADSYSTDEDVTLVVAAAAGVLANDIDVDGDTLNAMLIDNVTHGTLTLNPDGSFSYTPDANYFGPDSFTYKVDDGTVDGNTVTVDITVNSVNDPPVGVDDSYSVNEDSTRTTGGGGRGFIPGLLLNDTDVEGDPLTAVLVSGPAHGTLTFNSDGNFSYTPDPDYFGPDSFTYRPNDGTDDGNLTTVSIDVVSVNDAPVGVADSYSTDEDTPLNIAAPGVLVNDTDLEGNPLTAVLVSGPAHGTLTFNPDGSFDYTPDLNYNGPDSFIYKPNDGIDDGNAVTVDLTVNPVNDAPVATADIYSFVPDTLRSVAAPGVLMNDIDVDGDPLAAELVSDVSNGTLVLNADGSFDYMPDPGFSGQDSFTYKVSDGMVDGNTVTVILTTNQAPVAADNSYSTDEDTTLSVAAPGVLANDTDGDSNPLTAVLVSGPAHGTLTLNPDGSFNYTPDADYNGPDSFTYKPNDGIDDGNTVTVDLTVNAINDAPVATGDSYSTDEDMTLNVAAPGVLANDTDVDGDTLNAVLVDNVTHGTLTFNADGSFSYTPDAEYSGPDSFTYQVNDGSVDGNIVTVDLTVNPVNDPPVAVDDSYSTNEDTQLDVFTGVLANDTDIEGDPLTAVLVSDPAHGTLTFLADGSFRYIPDADYTGPDSFTYRANDGTSDGNIATVNLTVDPVNDRPVAVADVGTTNEDSVLTVPAPGVLANDTDVDGDALTVFAFQGVVPFVGTTRTLASGAQATLNADGSYTYNPNGKFEFLHAGQTATDTFFYNASDGSLNSVSATVTITITGVNDAPNAVANTYNGVSGNTPFTVAAAQGVLANDTDPDTGSTLSVTEINGTPIGAPIAVTGGSVSMNADGSFTFTPTTGFTGAASFTYTVSDGEGGTDTDTVTINIANNIWYVDKDYDAGANGASDGSFLHPFTDMTQLNGAGGVGDVDAAGDTIFIYDRSGTDVTTNIILENNQKLIGDGHAFTVNGMAIGASASNSMIDHDGAGVTLAQGNEVRGFDLVGTTTSAVGIQDGGGTVGTLTITGTSISGQGQILDIDQGGGLINATFTSLSSTGSTGANGGVIDLTGGFTNQSTITVTGATSITGTHSQNGIDVSDNQVAAFLNLNFQGNVTLDLGANNAINIANNWNSSNNQTTFVTATFSGAVKDIDTTSGTAINATNNNIGSQLLFTNGGLDVDTTSGIGLNLQATRFGVTGTGNTIDTATGQIINIQNAIMQPGGVNFSSLSASGTVAGTAINLNGLSGNGAPTFNVGTVNIAGTSGTNSDGIFIATSNGAPATYTFSNVTIGTTGGDGIQVVGGNATDIFTFNTVNIAGGVNGSGGHGVQIGQGAVVSSNGTVNINGGTITAGSFGDAVNIREGSMTVNIAASLTKTTDGNVVEIFDHETNNITFSGNISQTVGGVAAGILIQNVNSGTINFTGQTIGLTTGASPGVNLNNNLGSTINFNPAAGGAGLDITTTSGAGFLAAGGGTISVTGSGNTISTTTGQIINLSDVTVGAGGVNFASMASSGVVSNNTVIRLNNVDGGNFSGGNVSIAAITGAANDGIFIGGGSSSNFTFTSATINDSGDDGIELNGANGAVTFNTVNITKNSLAGSAIEVNGATNDVNVNGGTITNNNLGDGVTIIGGTGNVNIAATLSGGLGNNGHIVNINNHDSGTVTLSGNIAAGGGFDSGIVVTGSNGGTINFTGSTISLGTSGIGVNLTNNTGGTINFAPAAGGNGLDISSSSTAFNATGGGTVSVTGNGNTINNSASQILNFSDITIGPGGVTFDKLEESGTVANTVIRLNNVDGGNFNGGNVSIDGTSGAGSDGIFIGGGSSSNFTFGTVAIFGSSDDGVELNGDNGTVIINTANININSTGSGLEVNTPTHDVTVNAGTIANPGPGDAVTIIPGTGTVTINATVVPLLASGLPDANSIGGDTLTEAALASTAQAAIQHWAAAGATAEQLAAMSAVNIAVADLGGLAIGSSYAGTIVIDADAAGWGWFVDSTPGDDAEFSSIGGDLVARADSAAVGDMDLLTVLMHELGHQVGLGHDTAQTDVLMSATIDAGERHLPEAQDALAAASGDSQSGAAHVQGWVDSILSGFDVDGSADDLGNLLSAYAGANLVDHSMPDVAARVDWAFDQSGPLAVELVPVDHRPFDIVDEKVL